MGGGTYDPHAYKSYTSTIAGKSASAIYTRSDMHKDLDPRGVRVREARDGPDHPTSTPIIVGVDVTGSMDKLAEAIAHHSLGTLFQEVLDRKPVTDPQLMFMAIGDSHCDRAPLQVSQFESSNVIIEQLMKIWVERGGGGNYFESYTLPWYFAARHTSTDSYEKRGKKGYLFTLGDDGVPDSIPAEHIEEIFGDKVSEDISTKSLLEEVSKMYHVFHLCLTETRSSRGFESWQKVLGERALKVSDHEKLAEVIVSTIQIIEGADVDTVAKSWSGDTSLVVADATRSLAAHTGSGRVAAPAGVHRF